MARGRRHAAVHGAYDRRISRPIALKVLRDESRLETLERSSYTSVRLKAAHNQAEALHNAIFLFVEVLRDVLGRGRSLRQPTMVTTPKPDSGPDYESESDESLIVGLHDAEIQNERGGWRRGWGNRVSLVDSRTFTPQPTRRTQDENGGAPVVSNPILHPGRKPALADLCGDSSDAETHTDAAIPAPAEMPGKPAIP